MLATIKDIPQLARQWYVEKPKTAFGGMSIEWSIPLCAVRLSEALADPQTVVMIEKSGSTIVAACAASLTRPFFPPHPLTVVEWMWQGTNKKAIVKTWHDCKAWGKSHGALFASYSINQPQNNSIRWSERQYWRKL